MTHICVSKITIIGSDNGLPPGRRQAIIWTNAGILLIESLGTNFSEILIAIHTFSFKKMHLNMSSGKWRPFCLGLNVLREVPLQCVPVCGYIDHGPSTGPLVLLVTVRQHTQVQGELIFLLRSLGLTAVQCVDNFLEWNNKKTLEPQLILSVNFTWPCWL